MGIARKHAPRTLALRKQRKADKRNRRIKRVKRGWAGNPYDDSRVASLTRMFKGVHPLSDLQRMHNMTVGQTVQRQREQEERKRKAQEKYGAER